MLFGIVIRPRFKTKGGDRFEVRNVPDAMGETINHETNTGCSLEKSVDRLSDVCGINHSAINDTVSEWWPFKSVDEAVDFAKENLSVTGIMDLSGYAEDAPLAALGLDRSPTVPRQALSADERAAMKDEKRRHAEGVARAKAEAAARAEAKRLRADRRQRDMLAIADVLTEWRGDMSLEEASDVLGISAAAIGNIEAGKGFQYPSLLLRALRVPRD